MEQLAADRVEVQRAREELLREQKRVTTDLQEERRSVAMERAQLSSAHREIITREKHKTDSTIQVSGDDRDDAILQNKMAAVHFTTILCEPKSVCTFS